VEVLGWLASDGEGGDWDNIIFGHMQRLGVRGDLSVNNLLEEARVPTVHHS